MTANRGLFFLTFCVSVCITCEPIAKAQKSEQVSIVATVELVQIPVIVFDDKGKVATNLKKSDFRLLEDGVEQKILYFERERLPVSFVIVADVSSSMTNKIPFVQEAALSLLNPLPQQDQYLDEYSVLGIGKRVKLLMPFTRDQEDLERRLPLLLTATNESTALFDGVWLGVNTARREASNQRRAMIIISDGGDNHSRYNLRETRELLEEADVPVFAVKAGPLFELPSIFLGEDKKRKRFPTGRESVPQFPSLPMGRSQTDYIGPAERRGPHILSTLTEVTGGGVFTANDEEDLPRIVRTIGLAVRYQYVLTYKPLHEGRTEARREKGAEENGFHKIHLELYPKENFKGYGIPYYKRRYRSVE